MAKADWIKIKNEYINTDISQRKLAEKYKVSFSTLKTRAIKEKWNNDKKENCRNIATKVTQKTTEKIIEQEVDRITNILNTSDVMQDKIMESLQQLNMQVDMFGNVHETEVIDTNKLKKLISSLKDIKDIVKDLQGDNENIEDLSDAENEVFGND